MNRAQPYASMKTLPLLLATFIMAGCAPTQTSQTNAVDLLIDEVTIVTMDESKRVIENGAIAIRDGAIESILDASEARPEATERIVANGHLAIPGLVNTHGHVPMTLMRGLADDLSLLDWLENHIFPAEAANVSPEFVYWGTKLAAFEMIRNGTTTFTDMYFFEEDVARATDEMGLRGVLGQTIIGFPAPDHQTPEEALEAAEAFINKYKDHPRVYPSVAPHALYTTDLEIVAKAHRLAEQHGVIFPDPRG